MSFKVSGWRTVLDLDFTTFGNQTIAANGVVAIGGRNWTKINSANEASSVQLVNGTGMVWTPGGSAGTPTDYNGANRTLPGLFLPLAPIVSGLDPDTAIRVWMHNSVNAPIGNFDSAVLAIDTNSTGYGFVVKRGIGTNGAGLQHGIEVNGASINFASQNFALAAANNVIVLEPGCDGFGVGSLQRVFYGQYAGGWPALSSMSIAPVHTVTFAAQALDCTRMTPAASGVLLGAQRVQAVGGGSYTTTIARLKIEAHT